MGNFTFFADKPVENYKKGDVLLIVSIVLLWGLGIFTLFVCTPNTAERLFSDRFYFVRRQLIWSAVGLALMLATALIPMNVIRKILPFIVLGSLLLCVLTLVPGLGDTKKGASRWIHLGSVSFQPSEAAKFAIVLFLANYFAKDYHSSQIDDADRNFFRPLLVLFLFIGAIILGKDFSTGLFVFVIGVIMFFVTGARMIWFGPLLMLAIPACVLLIGSEQYRIMRVMAFFKPEEYTLTSGYQQFASQLAIIEGGFWGSGLGSGLVKVNSIPEVHADYIFAGWASAMGLIGVAAYFVVLIFFAWRAYRISFTTPNVFAAYGAFGCTSVIVLQSLVNCGVVCGALPTTGIPLPFFSSGGSSLMFTMAMCGFIINASCCDSGEDYYDNITTRDENLESFNGVVVEYE